MGKQFDQCGRDQLKIPVRYIKPSKKWHVWKESLEHKLILTLSRTTCSLQHLQLCGYQGVIWHHMLFHICLLNQRQKHKNLALRDIIWICDTPRGTKTLQANKDITMGRRYNIGLMLCLLHCAIEKLHLFSSDEFSETSKHG